MTTHPNALQAETAHPPYFLARTRDGRIETFGQPDGMFGHRIPSAARAVADGVFAQWHWDGARLSVSNDRYGFFPLFWCKTPGNGVCISPSIVTLIEQGASTALNVEALSVFFRLGFFVGDDTPFWSINAVPPNALFQWEDGRIECLGRWPQTATISALSRSDAIDQYIDLFAKAMAKRAPMSDNFAVPTSGGRDSRHILLELHRTGLKPAVCVSALDNPPDPNQDPEIGKQLCAALGFKHVIIEQQLSLLAAQVRKNRETNFCATAHAWYLALADFLNNRFDCVYDGIAGDVLSQSSYMDPSLDAAFRSGNVHAIASALLSQHKTSYATLKGLLKDTLRDALDPDVAMKRLTVEVARHLDAPNPIASFFFWNRTRRQIALAPYSLLRGIPRVYAPFLDHDLFDFVTTLPASVLMDRTFHTDAIARAYQDFAHISYADHKHAPPADDHVVRRRFLAEATRRFLLKKPSSLTKNIAPRAKILLGHLSMGRINPSISPLLIYLDQIEALTHQSDG